MNLGRNIVKLLVAELQLRSSAWLQHTERTPKLTGRLQVKLKQCVQVKFKQCVPAKPLPGPDHRDIRCESGSDCAPLPAQNALLTVSLQMRRGKTAASGFGPLRQAGPFSGVYVQTRPESVGLKEIFQVQLKHAEACGQLLEV